MKRPYVLISTLAAALLLVLVVHQFITLRKAHSSFENYSAFRGCVQLLSRTGSEGVCKTDTGQTIKIVKFQDKWYLDGDLPWACLGQVCLGI